MCVWEGGGGSVVGIIPFWTLPCGVRYEGLGDAQEVTEQAKKTLDDVQDSELKSGTAEPSKNPRLSWMLPFGQCRMLPLLCHLAIKDILPVKVIAQLQGVVSAILATLHQPSAHVAEVWQMLAVGAKAAPFPPSDCSHLRLFRAQ